jgi:hypothetical protein
MADSGEAGVKIKCDELGLTYMPGYIAFYGSARDSTVHVLGERQVAKERLVNSCLDAPEFVRRVINVTPLRRSGALLIKWTVITPGVTSDSANVGPIAT